MKFHTISLIEIVLLYISTPKNFYIDRILKANLPSYVYIKRIYQHNHHNHNNNNHNNLSNFYTELIYLNSPKLVNKYLTDRKIYIYSVCIFNYGHEVNPKSVYDRPFTIFLSMK